MARCFNGTARRQSAGGRGVGLGALRHDEVVHQGADRVGRQAWVLEGEDQPRDSAGPRGVNRHHMPTPKGARPCPLARCLTSRTFAPARLPACPPGPGLTRWLLGSSAQVTVPERHRRACIFDRSLSGLADPSPATARRAGPVAGVVVAPPWRRPWAAPRRSTSSCARRPRTRWAPG
jgi:hypothetical protein